MHIYHGCNTSILRCQKQIEGGTGFKTFNIKYALLTVEKDVRFAEYKLTPVRNFKFEQN